MPHSPTATGKGSNQVMAESLYDSLTRKKSLSWTMQQMDVGRDRYANHWNCQGERKPLNLLHSHVQNEVLIFAFAGLEPGNSMLTGGFPRYPSSPYWNCNMYGNAGNVPFNAFMVPPTLYGPPYMRYMHGSMPSPG
ncbi:hypothetical protein RND71_015965 [Anisodus tanguticus]|uniref:Uncharacterized protein n=1 Tax=Anisodus tanguticus TaxID=243964 RepID=A0AAE1S827_9SOLA|nr:hypothetical protein RND71_015965 [Anisodus tanguticus]